MFGLLWGEINGQDERLYKGEIMAYSKMKKFLQSPFSILKEALLKIFLFSEIIFMIVNIWTSNLQLNKFTAKYEM